jgi:hypothetical protein
MMEADRREKDDFQHKKRFFLNVGMKICTTGSITNRVQNSRCLRRKPEGSTLIIKNPLRNGI